MEKQWNLNCSTIGPHLEIQIGRSKRVQTNRKLTSYQLKRVKEIYMVNWHLNAPIEKNNPEKCQTLLVSIVWSLLNMNQHGKPPQPKKLRSVSIGTWSFMQQEPTRNHHDHSPPAINAKQWKCLFKPKNSACFQSNHFPRGAIFYPHGGCVYPTVTLAYGTLGATIGALEARAFCHGWALRCSWGTWVGKWDVWEAWFCTTRPKLQQVESPKVCMWTWKKQIKSRMF